MVKMIPNIALITAVITDIEPYAQQTDFSIMLLAVKHAAKKSGSAFLYKADEEENIKALISNEKCEQANIKVKDVVTIEANKVSIDLWRVADIIS